MSVVVNRCARCGRSLGTFRETTRVQHCPTCETWLLVHHHLTLLPDPGGLEWGRLSEWEQAFLTSVRQQFAQRGTLTEKQQEKLESIYERHI